MASSMHMINMSTLNHLMEITINHLREVQQYKKRKFKNAKCSQRTSLILTTGHPKTIAQNLYC